MSPLGLAVARTSQTVPAKPFADWLNARVHRYSGLDEMARSFGVAVRTLHRYMACKSETKENGEYVTRHADEYNLENVEEMLHRAGFFLWDVYDEEDYLEEEPELRPLRTCLRPDTLLRVKALYDLGASLHSAAATVFSTSGYPHLNSLERALATEFRHQGWEVRDRGYYSSTRHKEGWLPPVRCEAITRKGSRCLRAPMRGSKVCVSHDPRRSEIVEGLARGRARHTAGCVPLAPFSDWLRGRCDEAGEVKAFAREIDESYHQVWQWLKYRDERMIHRITAERVLGKCGLTLDDLYSEQVAA